MHVDVTGNVKQGTQHHYKGTLLINRIFIQKKWTAFTKIENKMTNFYIIINLFSFEILIGFIKWIVNCLCKFFHVIYLLI